MNIQTITRQMNGRHLASWLVLSVMVASVILGLGLTRRVTSGEVAGVTPVRIAQPYNSDLVALKHAQAEQVSDAAMALPLPEVVTRADFAAFKERQAEQVSDAAAESR